MLKLTRRLPRANLTSTLIGVQFVVIFTLIYFQGGLHVTPCKTSNAKYRSLAIGEKTLILSSDATVQHGIIRSRRDRVRKQCANLSRTSYWSTLNPSGILWSHEGLNYCATYKIGSTFWIRAFRFMAQDYGTAKGPVRKPSDIDRFQVHNRPVRRLTKTGISNPLAQLLLSTGDGFMFTRDPYTRLWSAFIDKFVLPDFWTTAALEIADIVNRKNMTRYGNCVNNITFEELLLSVTRFPLNKIDGHWRPVHRICSPCHVDYDVIGKQETFGADAAYIIDRYGLDAIKETKERDKEVKDEIEMLVEFNLELLGSIKGNCFNKQTIAERLWLAFQMNGYIHKNKTFAMTEFVKRDRSKPALLDLIFRAIETHTSEMKRELKVQKYELMAEAYKRIPAEIMARIKEIYKYDFELFGYDAEPTFLQ